MKLHEIEKKSRSYCKSDLLYHEFRFGIIKNFKILICKLFGHRLPEDKNDDWCERCGLMFDEIYYPTEECLVKSCDCHKIMNSASRDVSISKE